VAGLSGGLEARAPLCYSQDRIVRTLRRSTPALTCDRRSPPVCCRWASAGRAGMAWIRNSLHRIPGFLVLGFEIFES